MFKKRVHTPETAGNTPGTETGSLAGGEQSTQSETRILYTTSFFLENGGRTTQTAVALLMRYSSLGGSYGEDECPGMYGGTMSVLCLVLPHC